MKYNPSIFSDIGLSESEVNVYTAILEQGRSTIQALLPHTSLSRPNLYYVIDSLLQKGLIVEIPGKKRIVEAVSPVKLQEIANDHVHQAEETRERIQHVLPDLIQTFASVTGRPITWHKAGIEGLAEIYDDIAKEAQELLIFPSSWDRKSPELNTLIDKAIKNQQKAGIISRVLLTNPESATKATIESLKTKNIHARFVKNENLSLPSQLLIWNNKIAITSFRTTLISMVIENEDAAETLRSLFNHLWATDKTN